MADAPIVVKLDNVSFAYAQEPILKDVNLELTGGDMICLVGPNGGGKTTLLRLILGMLKPDRGQIRVLDTTPEVARRQIGYVPQYTHFDLKFPVSVMDVVLMGRLQRGRFGPFARRDRAVARQALPEAGLADLENRPFSALSGGQRQRVLIARALASEPRMLLLDEPTSNVDALAEQKLYELLRELNQRLTIVMVSHDLGVVSQMVDSVVCVHQVVHLHPTSQLTGEIIRNMYGGADVSLIRHDHHCSEEGHHHG